MAKCARVYMCLMENAIGRTLNERTKYGNQNMVEKFRAKAVIAVRKISQHSGWTFEVCHSTSQPFMFLVIILNKL